MENQETNQTDVYTIIEEPKKEGCKTCGSKKLKKSNVQLLFLGFGLLFLSSYGLITLVKDVVSWFTR